MSRRLRVRLPTSHSPLEKKDASIGVVKAEKKVAIATISASSIAVSRKAAAWVAESRAPAANETTAKTATMIAICIQMAITSPTNFPSRNSARVSGFERIVWTVRRSTSL